MAKNRKTGAKSTPREAPPKVQSPAVLTAHPPAKHPTLLAVSIALFALWFIFLLVTALAG